MIYFYLECDTLDNDIRSLFMAFYPDGQLKELKQRNMRVQRVICFFVCA